MNEIAEPLRTGGEGSELGSGNSASQLAASPRQGREEFGSHGWHEEESEGW